MVNYTPSLQRVGSKLEDQMSKTAADIMITSGLTLTVEMSVNEASSLIDKYQLSGAPVINQVNKLIGFLSQKDCLKFILDSKYYNDGQKKVDDFMSKTIMTISPSENVLYLADLFIKNNYQAYPVVDDEGFLLGVVTRSILFSEINKMTQTSW